MTEWYCEELTERWRQSLPVRSCLVDERSPFQHIQVFETRDWGRMLVLDGKVQCTEGDEFIYHEMLAHVPLMTHPDPRRVLVVGGGDGGTAREALRHPGVEGVTLAEIDARVIELSRLWLPDMAAGLQPDERLTLTVGDAADTIRGCEPQDVILIDSSDPEGPSEVLFSESFFQSLKRALKPDGILALQAGSPFFFRKQIEEASKLLAGMFTHVRPYLAPIPTYPGGTWCMMTASMSLDPCALTPEELGVRCRARNLDGRFYTPEVHRGSLSLPAFLRDL